MSKLLLIGLLFIVLVVIILILIIYGKQNKINKLQKDFDKTIADIEKRKKYEQGVKEDNEKLSKVTNGNKLSNFNDGLDLLRK